MPYTCWANTQQQPYRPPRRLTRSFVIVKKTSAVPAFYTRLQDFGKNRLEWLTHLRFSGFHFALRGQSWLYHLRHRQSSLAERYDQKKDINGKIMRIREAELSEQYKGVWRLPLCGVSEQAYSNPYGMSVEQLLEREEREQQKSQSPAYKRDKEIMEKFAKRKKNKRKK